MNGPTPQIQGQSSEELLRGIQQQMLGGRPSPYPSLSEMQNMMRNFAAQQQAQTDAQRARER